MADTTDEQLIVQFLEGDTVSLEVLFARHADHVYRFVVRSLADATTAEDLTQEIFVKAWQHLKRFDQNRSFKTWLFQIARNSIIDYFRKKKHLTFADISAETEQDFIETLADPSPLPHEVLEQLEKNNQIVGILAQLPPLYRTVLLLHLGEQLTFQEIADMADEPLNTVKSRYRRALSLLRRQIGSP